MEKYYLKHILIASGLLLLLAGCSQGLDNLGTENTQTSVGSTPVENENDPIFPPVDITGLEEYLKTNNDHISFGIQILRTEDSQAYSQVVDMYKESTTPYFNQDLNIYLPNGNFQDNIFQYSAISYGKDGQLVGNMKEMDPDYELNTQMIDEYFEYIDDVILEYSSESGNQISRMNIKDSELFILLPGLDPVLPVAQMSQFLNTKTKESTQIFSAYGVTDFYSDDFGNFTKVLSQAAFIPSNLLLSEKSQTFNSNIWTELTNAVSTPSLDLYKDDNNEYHRQKEEFSNSVGYLYDFISRDKGFEEYSDYLNGIKLSPESVDKNIGNLNMYVFSKDLYDSIENLGGFVLKN